MTKQELQSGLDCLLPEMKRDVEKNLANLTKFARSPLPKAVALVGDESRNFFIYCNIYI